MELSKDKNNIDYSTSFIRIVSICILILVQLLEKSGIITFSIYFLNLFIYIFLFISGYTFGKYEVINGNKRVKDRLVRIFIPGCVLLLIFFVYYISIGAFNFPKLLSYFLNLQEFFVNIKGLEHYQFLIAIIFCYFITPFLFEVKISFLELPKQLQIIIWSSIFLLWSYVSLYIPPIVGLNLGYVIFYAFSYYFANVWEASEQQLRSFKILFGSAVVIYLLNLNTSAKYANYSIVITAMAQAILSIGIYIILYKLTNRVKNKHLLSFINHVDNYSYEIFIVYAVFVIGPFSIIGFIPFLIVNYILILILSYVSARILKKISNYLIERVGSRESRMANFWGLMTIIFIIYVLVIPIMGMWSLKNVYSDGDQTAIIFISEKLIEYGLEAMVVGLFIFLVSYSFTRLKESEEEIKKVNKKDASTNNK